MAYEASGHDLQGALRPNRANPCSCPSAMAMVLSDARGETAREIAGVRSRLIAARFDAANARLLAILTTKAASRRPARHPCDSTAPIAMRPTDAVARLAWASARIREISRPRSR
jgi:hypothetical protein